MTFRVPCERMLGEFERALAASGFDQADAAALARVFADNTCDGVASHGINRFPGFVRDVRGGRLDPAARARRVAALGALEQWDGHRGPGILNALACMDRAVELAREHAVGAVALRNTSHWMRAGTYGLRAAAAGCIGICWTNTTRLMPPHGSAEKRLGNNPLVMAIPAPGGDPVLLDMAMSQFSGGRVQIHERSGEPLPVPGGYDAEGRLTTDAAALERPLPIGLWKGSGLGPVPGPGGGPRLRGPHDGGDLAGAAGGGGCRRCSWLSIWRRPAIPTACGRPWRIPWPTWPRRDHCREQQRGVPRPAQRRAPARGPAPRGAGGAAVLGGSAGVVGRVNTRRCPRLRPRPPLRNA